MKLNRKQIKTELDNLLKIAVDIPCSCDSIEVCFDLLRLHIKYLRMDLEATKRELKALRKH